MEYSLDDLKKDTAKQQKYQTDFVRLNYQLARKLGFTAAESTALKSKSRDTIIKLATEKGFIVGPDDPLVNG